jgi:predicted metalloprotease with PDZ domain
VARQFVLLRIGNMRGVDLELFEFDYDLTWMAFFLDGNERILGRFGGRPAEDANKYHSLEGLRFALAAALQRHRQAPAGQLAKRTPRTVEEYPAINKLGPKACIHCHNTYEFQRDSLQSKQQWNLEQVWVYPLPENIGLTLAVEQQNRVTQVAPKSPAAAVGVEPGDVLLEVSGLPIISIADLQYALHRAPALGTLPVRWRHEGKAKEGKLPLFKDWKHTDLSWRPSVRTLEPASGLHGTDLTAEEKKKLGLAPKQLAFRQGNFLTKQAQFAGIRINDIIVGVDGKQLEMTVRQFDVYVRLTYRKEDMITVNLFRDGKRLDLQMKLSGN